MERRGMLRIEATEREKGELAQAGGVEDLNAIERTIRHPERVSPVSELHVAKFFRICYEFPNHFRERNRTDV